MKNLSDNDIKYLYKKIVLINVGIKQTKVNHEESVYFIQDGNFDSSFKLSDYIEIKNGTENFDKKIKELCLFSKKNIDLLLLLRCRVSHKIKDLINKIHQNITEQYNINLDIKDLMSCFLEDDGNRYIFAKDLNSKRKSKIERKPFDYEFIEEEINRINQLKQKENNNKLTKRQKYIRISPFSAEIIASFNHLNISEISNWTKYKLYGDSLFRYKIGIHGRLMLKTIWTLLGGTSLTRILASLEATGNIKNKKLEKEKELVEYYKNNYKSERSKYKKRYNTYIGWDPSYDDFLNESEQKLLRNIGKQLKIYIGANGFFDSSKFSEDGEDGYFDVFSKIPSKQKLKANELEFFIAKFLRKKTKFYLGQQLEKDMKTWKSYPERKKAWLLMSKINLENPYEKNQIKDEYSLIASKCKSKDGQSRQVSWLSKRFNYEKTLINVFNSFTDELREIINSDTYIEKFNKENPNNQINDETIKLIRKKFLYDSQTKAGKFEKKFILDNPSRFKKFILGFQNEFNPKKDRKTVFIVLLRELLKENNIK